MAIIVMHQSWAFAFGILGNLVSFMVYLAPLPTFYKIYKGKSTDGFQSIPYVVALFSAMLWLYYGFLKTDMSLLITINSVGCVIETTYIVIYLVYAPRSAKMFTLKLLLLLNVGAFGVILLFTLTLAKGHQRLIILGWICSGFAICVFAAPLSIMRSVIKTRSVEFMPFSLSFFLTLTAIIWLAYGFLLKDFFVALPNILGFLFGIGQMVLYIIYKDARILSEEKLPEQITDIKQCKLENLEVVPMDKEIKEVELNESQV